MSLGSCDRVCRHCKARFSYEERLKHGSARFVDYHRCCMGGKLVLRPQPQYPPYIRQLFTDRHFMENIKAYNFMFSIISLRAQVDNSVKRGRGPYVFKISGQSYHWIGGLCQPENCDPRFLQLYVFDTQNEVDNRLQPFDSGVEHCALKLYKVSFMCSMKTMNWFGYLGLQGTCFKLEMFQSSRSGYLG